MQLLENIDGINKRILSLTLKKLKNEDIIKLANTEDKKYYTSSTQLW